MLLKLPSAVPYMVASVLLLAAALKTQQLADVQPSTDFLSARWLRVLVIELEIVCGLALILGFRPRTTRRACQFLFSVFLLVAVLHFVFGARSCGCLGKVQIEPLGMALLDILLLAALFFWRPGENTKGIVRVIFPLVVIVPIGLIPAWAFVIGAETTPLIEASPALIDLGALPQVSRRQLSVTLRNTREEAVSIERLEFSCSCLRSKQSVLALQSLQEVELDLDLDLGKEPAFLGDLDMEVKGWTSSEGKPVFTVRVRVQVVPQSEQREAILGHPEVRTRKTV